MAFSFRRRHQQESVQTIAANAPVAAPAAGDSGDPPVENDAAKRTLELLELDLVAMVRQVERAAASVADGATSTAETLATIRERTAALTRTHRRSRADRDDLLEASEAFAKSAADIGSQVMNASRPCRSGERRGKRRERRRRPPAAVVAGDRQRRQSDRLDRPADDAARAQFDHRGRARRRSRPRLRRGRFRSEGARGADPAGDRRDRRQDRSIAARCRRLRSSRCSASRSRSTQSARCSKASTARCASKARPRTR